MKVLKTALRKAKKFIKANPQLTAFGLGLLVLLIVSLRSMFRVLPNGTFDEDLTVICLPMLIVAEFYLLYSINWRQKFTQQLILKNGELITKNTHLILDNLELKEQVRIYKAAAKGESIWNAFTEAAKKEEKPND